MVAAFGRPDEEGAALAVGEGGAEAVGPGVGFEVGGFVEDDEIQAFAAERVGVEAAFHQDGGAVCELDGEFLFGGFLRPEGLGDCFQAAPDDAFGEFFGRGDIPDQLIGCGFGGAGDFGQREFGFPKAAAGNQHAEAFGGVKDLKLACVETEL